MKLPLSPSDLQTRTFQAVRSWFVRRLVIPNENDHCDLLSAPRVEELNTERHTQQCNRSPPVKQKLFPAPRNSFAHVSRGLAAMFVPSREQAKHMVQTATSNTIRIWSMEHLSLGKRWNPKCVESIVRWRKKPLQESREWGHAHCRHPLPYSKQFQSARAHAKRNRRHSQKTQKRTRKLEKDALQTETRSAAKRSSANSA